MIEADNQLINLWTAATTGAPVGADCPDAEAIFDAVAAVSAADQATLQPVLDHVAACAHCAEVWRMARTLLDDDARLDDDERPAADADAALGAESTSGGAALGAESTSGGAALGGESTSGGAALGGQLGAGGSFGTLVPHDVGSMPYAVVAPPEVAAPANTPIWRSRGMMTIISLAAVALLAVVPVAQLALAPSGDSRVPGGDQAPVYRGGGDASAPITLAAPVIAADGAVRLSWSGAPADARVTVELASADLSVTRSHLATEPGSLTLGAEALAAYPADQPIRWLVRVVSADGVVNTSTSGTITR